jgi:hypothetical protein
MTTITMSRKEKIDLFLGKWVSRKLTAFLIASIALFAGSLESADWTIVATMYVAVQGATDIVERLMKAKNGVA